MSIPRFGRAGRKAVKGYTALMLFCIGAFLMPGKGGKMILQVILILLFIWYLVNLELGKAVMAYVLITLTQNPV